MKNYKLSGIIVGCITGLTHIAFVIHDAQGASPMGMGIGIAAGLAIITRIAWNIWFEDTHRDADKREKRLPPRFLGGERGLNTLMLNNWKWVAISFISLGIYASI